MIPLLLPFKFLIAFTVGAVIGLERESQDELNSKSTRIEAPHNVGVRTFSFIALLGTLAGVASHTVPLLFILLSASVFLLILAYYVIQSRLTKDVGFTTELALIYSYLVGVAIAIEFIPIQLTLAISVIVIILLSVKTRLKTIIEGISSQEFNAFLGFALIALVILPFLPNQGYSISDIPGLVEIAPEGGLSVDKISHIELINPFKLWFIVALITGLDILGHVLERIFGQGKGRLIASVAGGFISSTATTQGLAQESTATKKIHPLIGAAIFANVSSFFQLALLLAPVNIHFLLTIAPSLIAIIVVGSITGWYFLSRSDKKSAVRKARKSKETDVQIFAITPALKFAFLYLVVTVVSRVALELFGQNAFLIAAALASLTGIDAVLITVAQLFGQGLSTEVALLAFVIVNAVNLLGKSFYSFLQGSREFALKFFLAVLALIGVSFIGFLF